MKTTDSVMREFDEKLDKLLCYAGNCVDCNAQEFVQDGVAHNDNCISHKLKSLFSHSLAEARREERERRNKKLEGLKKVVEYNIRKQEANFDVSLRMYNKGYLKALDDLLTGDNPESEKV